MRMDGWGHTLRSGVRVHMDHEAARAVEPSVADTAAMPAVVVRGALVCGEDIRWEVHRDAVMGSVQLAKLMREPWTCVREVRREVKTRKVALKRLSGSFWEARRPRRVRDGVRRTARNGAGAQFWRVRRRNGRRAGRTKTGVVARGRV